jgi:hypothetical protein
MRGRKTNVVCVVQALGRLTERESYERAYRHRVAHMQAMAHAPLPDGQHFPKEKVSPSLLVPSAGDCADLT